RLRQGARQRLRQVAALVVGEKPGEGKFAPVRGEAQIGPTLWSLGEVHAHPIGVEVEALRFAGRGNARHRQYIRRQLDRLVKAPGAVVELERSIYQRDVEAEEAEHRPSAFEQERHAGDEADTADRRHEDQEAGRPKRSVRIKHRAEGFALVRRIARRDLIARLDRRLFWAGIIAHVASLSRGTTVMKSLDRVATKAKSSVGKRPPPKASSKRLAVGGKRRTKLAKPAIEEMFRRFEAADPDRKSELEYVNPFTLLVAVVLSAQATDASVNKATRALFKIADTPEKMVRLSEGSVRDFIKTIGLYRNKARNVIELSRQLIANN